MNARPTDSDLAFIHTNWDVLPKKEISTRLGVGHTTFYRWTRQMGLTGRKRSAATVAIREGPTKEQRRAISRARKNGSSVDACANAAGVTRYTLDAWVKSGRLVLNEKGRPQPVCKEPHRAQYGLARCTYSNVNVGGRVGTCGRSRYCGYRKMKE